MTREQAALLAEQYGFEEGFTDSADAVRNPATKLISLFGRYFMWDEVCQDFESIE